MNTFAEDLVTDVILAKINDFLSGFGCWVVPTSATDQWYQWIFPTVKVVGGEKLIGCHKLVPRLRMSRAIFN